MNLIQGSGGKGGGGGGGGIEDDDTLRSRQYAKIIDAVCEGEIEGFENGAYTTNIYLDDTPLQTLTNSGVLVDNFKNYSIKYNQGTQNQGVLPGFDTGVESEHPVDLEVTNDGIGKVQTINSTTINRIRVTMGVPRLTVTDSTNGNVHGSTVQYKVSLQENNGAYVDQLVGSTGTVGSIVSQIGTSVANSTGVSGVVLVNSTKPAYNPQRHSGVISIEYKLSTSGTWLTLESKNIVINVGNNPNNDSYTHLPTEVHFSKENLASGIYNVRAYATSGSITTSLIAFSSTIPSTIVTISGKTTSRFQKSHIINVSGTGSPYNVKVTRITPDAPNQYTSNKTFWDSYTGIVDTKLSYPNTALIGLEIDSSQFRSIPRRAYHLKLKKVSIPTNYFPIERTYTRNKDTGADTGSTQIWDGSFYTAWTDNPAWCFYDLITNSRYGLGNRIPASWNDKAALYTIGQYCDELVKTGFKDSTGADALEPRFTCNLYLQTQEEALNVIQNMASIFRAMVYWLGGVVSPVADKPEEVWAQFTNADVIDGAFTYQGSSNIARHTVALVTWNDPADRYKQKIEYVEDSEGIKRYGVNQTELIAMGCTSRGQARRLGKWLLYTERLEVETVSFSTGLKGTNLLPGKIINTFDQFRTGVRHAGRIIGSTNASITIDAPVVLPSGTCSVDLEAQDGTLTTKFLSNTFGSTSTLKFINTLNSIHSGTAQAGSNNSLTLANTASETPDIYIGNTVFINSGIGIYEERGITASRKNLTTHSELASTGATTGTPEGTSPPTISTVLFEGKTVEIITFTNMSVNYAASRRAGNAANVMGRFPFVSGQYYSVSCKVALSRVLTSTEHIIVYVTGSGFSKNIVDFSSASINPTIQQTYIDENDTSIGVTTTNGIWIYGLNILSDVSVYLTDIHVENVTTLTNKAPCSYIMTNGTAAVGVAIDSPWGSTPNGSSTYTIGASPLVNGTIWMLTEPSLYPETWRVLGITEENSNSYTINAIAHNPSKFNFIENDDVPLTINPTSIFRNVNTVAPVTYGIDSVVDSIYKLSNNTIATKIHVSWNPSAGA